MVKRIRVPSVAETLIVMLFPNKSRLAEFEPCAAFIPGKSHAVSLADVGWLGARGSRRGCRRGCAHVRGHGPHWKVGLPSTTARLSNRLVVFSGL